MVAQFEVVPFAGARSAAGAWFCCWRTALPCAHYLVGSADRLVGRADGIIGTRQSRAPAYAVPQRLPYGSVWTCTSVCPTPAASRKASGRFHQVKSAASIFPNCLKISSYSSPSNNSPRLLRWKAPSASAKLTPYQAQRTLARWLQPRAEYSRRLCRQTKSGSHPFKVG